LRGASPIIFGECTSTADPPNTEVVMSKPCPWCGAVVASDARICPKCRSAQPSTAPDPAPGQLAPPPLGVPAGGVAPPAFVTDPAGPPPPGPPPPGYPAVGHPTPGYPAPPSQGSNAGRTAIIAVAVGVGALVLIAFVCILAITFLGRSTSSKFVAVDPVETSVSGTGRDYPAEVRSNFLESCSTNSTAAACSCALEEIEQAYTLGEFVDAEQDYMRTGDFPARMTSIMQGCMQGG
jgi:hypothetical protein